MSNIDRPVMILNKNWKAIRIKKARKAINIVFRGRGLFVDEEYNLYDWDKWFDLDIRENDRFIITTKKRVRVPELCLLTFYKDFYNYNIRLTKKNIFIRDRFKCQYTGKEVDFDSGDIDHVVPKSRGGKTVWDNLVLCDKTVNKQKGNKMPDEIGLKLLKEPKKPKGDELLIDHRLKFLGEIPESWKPFLK